MQSLPAFPFHPSASIDECGGTLQLRIDAPTQTDSIAHTAAPMQIALLVLDSASFLWLASRATANLAGVAALHPLPSHANAVARPDGGFNPVSEAPQKTMGRSVWAVVAGFLVVVVLSTATDAVLHAAGIFPSL